jgi:aryl-alcohol dehydrogenase (NADP+)
MGIGHPSWREWVLDEKASRPIVKRVLDAGINFIDTCDYYSNGESENAIGRMMKDFVKREEVVLATKAGNPMGKGPNAKGYSRKHLFEAVEASLKRLGTDYIDLYQTHWPDPEAPFEEQLETLDELVRAGKVRIIGNSNETSWGMMKSLAVAKELGTARYQTIQNNFSLNNRRFEDDLAQICRQEGVSLIPYSPLAGDR